MRWVLITLVLSGCLHDWERVTRHGQDRGDARVEAGQDAFAGSDAGQDTPADAGHDTGPVNFPATCVEVHRLTPMATDGTFTLYVAGNPSRPWPAYCHDLAGTPLEYLTVTNPENFSQYTAGGVGTSVRTVYRRIRIDPVTLRVSTGDQRFAMTTGMIASVPSMPYGMAGDCNAAQTGIANIDLRGTPFAVTADAFIAGGWTAAGHATYSNGDQVVDLVGGGYCGWIAPRPMVSDQATAIRGTTLQLIYGGGR